nr:Maf family protein [uncultured Desulfobulbus sp.]
MFTARIPLLLASASPRRKDFLNGLGLTFSIHPADIDETPLPAENPEAFALRMARDKAQVLSSQYSHKCIIAADTVVALDQQIYGKPESPEQALSFLKQLQGRTHQVITGFSVLAREHNLETWSTETTLVTFGQFSTSVLQSYVNSGDPLDKAGAYGIQGIGTFLVQSIEGSYSNVVGLPLNQLLNTLLKHNIIYAN